MAARINGESPYDADYRLGASLHSLAQEVDGLGVNAVHHYRKAMSADFVDDVSGTNGLAGAADTITVLRRERESNDGVMLVTGRDVTEASYALRFDAGRWDLNGDTWHDARTNGAAVAATVGRGDTATQLVAHITANPGARPKDMSDALGISVGAANMALSRMRTADLVRSDKGRYYLPAPDLLGVPT